MLKRIGAGAAIAWTAPVLTSMRTPAFAQSGCGPEPCTGCTPLPCTPQNFCQVPCFAFCVQRIDNCCFCSPAIGWNNPPSPPICSSDSDCSFFAPGSVCVKLDPCWGGSGNVGCAAPCPGSDVQTKPGMKVVR